MFCFVSASFESAWPNGAATVRWPSAAIEAIIADVFRRGLAGASTDMEISFEYREGQAAAAA
jgi:hypothetical protein